MQYIAPTLIFLTAVFVFDEPFSRVKLLAFGLIWAALAIYSLPLLTGRIRSSQKDLASTQVGAGAGAGAGAGTRVG
jgi:hypothetical protein